MGPENKQTPHQIPRSNQLLEYELFQLTVSKNRRISDMYGPSSAKSKVSCGGRFRYVIKAGGVCILSKLDLDGDDAGIELMVH